MVASALSILVDEKRVNDLLQQRGGALAILREGCNVLTFVCFLALFTTMALVEPLQVHRSFEAYLHRRFDSQAAMPLDQVDSIEAFWLYMERSFLPAIYGNNSLKYTYPGYQLETFLPMDAAVDETEAIRLLGAGVLIKQVKIVPKRGCIVPETYQEAFPNCYGPYYPDAVDTAEYGPTGDQGGKMFVWSNPSPEDTKVGKLATYEPGGFMSLMGSNYTGSVDLIRKFKEHDWLTQGTRAIFLDFTVYNFNMGLYCVCQIIFEVSLTGSWVPTFHTDVLRQRYLNPLGLGTNTELLQLGGEAVLVLFVFYYFVEECKEFCGFEKFKTRYGGIYLPKVKLDYFKDAWNLLDLSSLAFIVITLWYRIQTWSLASNIMVHVGDPSGQSIDTFTDYGKVATHTRFVRSLVAFNAVLMWFKAVKFINLFPYISIFMETVIVSQNKMISFIVLMISVLTGFVLAYSTAFGEKLLDFQTPFKAAIFMMRVFLGDADLSVVRISAAPWLGPAYIVFFVVVALFVLMNIFYGIMVSSLSIARERREILQRAQREAQLRKAQELGNQLAKEYQLEKKFRQVFPGLYSRINNARKKADDREQERDAALAKKDARSLVFSRDDLGPASPNCGRRPQRKEKGDDGSDGENSDAGSEPDLGPLRNLQQLRGIDMSEALGGKPPGSPKAGTGMKMLQDQNAAAEQEEMERKAVDKMIEATEYIAKGIVSRTREARNVLFSEMGEAEQVLQGIGNVLEVLKRRATDLDMQQQQLLDSL